MGVGNDMDKNLFRYTVTKNIDSTFVETFTLEEIPIKLRPWLDANYLSFNNIKSVDQCTGESDINNIPIFENDIVQQVHSGETTSSFRGIVQFLEGAFWAVNCDCDGDNCIEFPIYTKDHRWQIIKEDEEWTA